MCVEMLLCLFLCFEQSAFWQLFLQGGHCGEKTAPTAAAAGADVAVMGSALFNAAEPERLVRLVRLVQAL